ncbi:hypothetical protein HDU83_002557 [Entophlyctis luteolus]|nr:hypothetical protein HDU83_002557 [Entophlyctis luteolus]
MASSSANTLQFEDVSGHVNPAEWKKDVIHDRVVAICLDSSEESTKAFYWALSNFFKHSSDSIKNKLILLSDTEGNKMRLEAYVKSQMEKARLTIGTDTPLRGILLKGDPRVQICDAVDSLEVDVIVVGTRGLGAVKRAVMGSVSDYISKHSSCPCVIVK